jgi:hypothetical protein
MGVAEATLGLWEGHQEKKKKEREKWVWDFGGGQTTPKGRSHPLRPVGGYIFIYIISFLLLLFFIMIIFFLNILFFNF